MGKKNIHILGRAAVFIVCFSALALFRMTGLHPGLENLFLDGFFKARDSLFSTTAAGSPVTIVGIDRETLAAYPTPVIFWDREFAETIRIIASARARVIGFDVLHLARLDATPYKNRMERLSKAILSTKNIVLPYSSETGDVPVYVARHLEEKLGLAGNLSPREKIKMLSVAEKVTGIGFGFVDMYEDEDGIIRRAFLTAGEGALGVSFPMRLFSRYSGIGRRDIRHGPHTIIAGPESIPLEEGALIINYSGPPGSFSMVPMAKVIRNRDNEEWLEKHFRNRAVIIGAADPLLMDFHNTPYISSTAGKTRGMYGAEIIASTFDTLLRRRYIRQSGIFTGLALCFIFSLLGIVLTRMPLGRGIAVAALSEAAYLGLAFSLFVFFGYEIAVALPLVALPVSFAAGYLFEHQILGRDRALLKSVLSSYLDPRVVEHVVRDGDAGILAGQRREITVLFSDIRNFTSLSEKLNRPEDVVDILNVYLPKMSGIILASEGCVDKFIGDGIMAFWNAPNDVTGHAEKAVRCALAMQDTMKEVNEVLRQKGLVKEGLAIGIGIHTGHAVVGNIGSEIKNDYTAVGDVVNLASRLEGKTKDFRYNIIISSEVFRQIRDMDLRAKPIGRIEVKGKKKKVQVYGIETC